MSLLGSAPNSHNLDAVALKKKSLFKVSSMNEAIVHDDWSEVCLTQEIALVLGLPLCYQIKTLASGGATHVTMHHAFDLRTYNS